MRIEDFGGFRHETHAGKYDDIGLRIAGEQREFKTVAHLVRHLLNLGRGVIMGERDHFLGHRKSSYENPPSPTGE